MDEAERDALRARVEAEPADARGELARTLMVEVDRLCKQKDARDRASFIESLMVGEHLSREDAERYVDMGGKPLPQMEMGPCRACRGHGSEHETGCLGGRWEKCSSCQGRGVRMRLRLPWAPHGEAIEIGLPISRSAATLVRHE